MTELKTDYKEDILETSQQGKRTFNIVSKTGEILFEDVHIEDVSKYTQVGDEYGQEIINAQNNAINEISKGSGLVFDTYQDYLDAKARGEVAVGNTIYIKEGNQSEITALQVVYNNSNVKLALDSLSNKKLVIGTPTLVYNAAGTITVNTTLYTAPSDGFINLSPVLYNGFGSIVIGNVGNYFYNSSSNEMRANICGFIKKGQTVRAVDISGAGIRGDMNMWFTPLSIGV